MHRLLASFVCGTLLLWASCSDPGNTAPPDPNAHRAGPDGTVDPPEYVIRQNRFYGLAPGRSLAAAGDKLIPNGTHYLIIGNEADTIGYLLASAADTSLIGDIHVTTLRAATEGDIRVGDPFSRLLIAYPKLVVQGSAAGGVYAYSSNKAFRLDEFTDEREVVPAAEVPGGTRVSEIIIRPGVRSVPGMPYF